MKKALFLALCGLFAAAAHAGCTESGQQCVHYKNGNVAGDSLSWKQKNGPAVSVETDAKSGKTLVNKKPGGQVKNGNAASMGLTCYAADANKNEQFCATSY